MMRGFRNGVASAGLSGLIASLAACGFSPSGSGMGDAGIDAGIDADIDAEVRQGVVRSVVVSNPTAGAMNVPVAIRLTDDESFRTRGLESGDDIVVRDDSGSEMPIDIELIDVAGGNLLVWIVIPSLPEGGTTLELQYGTETSAVGGSPWTGIADLVWHMESNTEVVDRSGNGLNGSVAQAGVSLANGPLGPALEFAGGVLAVAPGQFVDFATRSFTVSTWFRQAPNASSNISSLFFAGGPLVGLPGVQFDVGLGDWGAFLRDEDEVTDVNAIFGDADTIQFDGLHHLVVVVDRREALTVVSVYVDGRFVNVVNVNGVFGSLTNSAERLRVGGFVNSLNGVVDELQILPFAADENWIALSSQNGIGALATVSSP